MAFKAKKIVTILLSLLISNPAYACDFSTVKKVDGGFLYSSDCHKEIGKRLDELDLRREQVNLLKSNVDLYKDTADLQKQRQELWFDEAKSLEQKIKNTDRDNKIENALFFSLGVLLMYGATRAVR